MASPVRVHIQSASDVTWQTQGQARLGGGPEAPHIIDLQGQAADDGEARLAGLMEALAPPPVPLADFSAERRAQTVTLQWSVVPVPGADRYMVQRSSDRRHWRDIGMVASADHGTALETYVFSDPDPATGTNYYRLVQTSVDGRRVMSDMLAVEVLAQATHVTHLYPQPLLFGTAIVLDLKAPAPVRITVVDENRQPIAAVYAQQTSVGRHRVELDLDSLPPGDYLCEIVVGDATCYRHLAR